MPEIKTYYVPGDIFAETLDDPYYRRVPLPRITGYQKLDQEAQIDNMVRTHPEQDPAPLLGPGANINGSKHNISGGPRTYRYLNTWKLAIGTWVVPCPVQGGSR